MNDSLLDSLYRDYVDDYNDGKKITTRIPQKSINDVSFYFISAESLKLHNEEHTGTPEFDEFQISLHKNPLHYLPNGNIHIVCGNKYRTLNFTVSLTESNHCTVFVSDRRSASPQFQTWTTDGKSNSEFDAITRGCFAYLMYMLNNKTTLVGTRKLQLCKKSGQKVIVPLTYITNKKYLNVTNYDLGEAVNIDWKHSWECIGHWRNIKGVGKNRDGNYGEFGKTWVNPCIKGQGELVKKLRVVR